jgi:hypothetical protein
MTSTRSGRVLRQSLSDLLTEAGHLLDNRFHVIFHVIEVDQGNHVVPAIPDCRSSWARGAP